MENNKKVLLTGITGFLGSHTAIQLLEKGYKVVGTLRDIKRASSIKEVIGRHTSYIKNLSLVEADIQDKNIWKTLMEEVDYVQHIASPMPKVIPKDENELIRPAVSGNLNILSTASICGVKRVVITSSTAAIGYGQPKNNKKNIFYENDWTDLKHEKDLTAYFKSKTLAEKAAWDYIKNDSSGLELTVICPGLILGPLLEEDFNASSGIIIKMLDGSMPAIPKIGGAMVDVRSVAALLILAMEHPDAKNQRFIGSAGYMTLSEIAGILKSAYPKMKIPSRKFPNFILHLFSHFDVSLKPILVDLDSERQMNNSKAVNVLGWRPEKLDKTILESADSILKFGIVKSR